MGRLALGVGITVVIFAAVIIGYNRTQEQPRMITAPRASKIRFEPSTLDLGTFLWGDQAEFVLELVNEGDQPIVIEQVAASCECTADDLPEDPAARTVPPGERFPVNLKMDMGTEAGLKQVAVTAVTRDRQRAQADVLVNIDPTWRLQHEGDLWDFGQYLIGGGPQEFPAWSLIFSSQTDRLSEVKPMVPWIEHELRPLPDDSAIEIILRCRPEQLRPGHHNGWVEFRTDSDMMPVQSRGLRVNVARALLPTPDPMVLPLDEEGRIDFMGVMGIAAPITSAEAPADSGLEVRVEDGVVFVRRVREARDVQPIRISVTTEDVRTGWAEVVVPNAAELLIPD